MSNAIINTIEELYNAHHGKYFIQINGEDVLEAIVDAYDGDDSIEITPEYVEEYAWNGMNVHVTEEQAKKIVDAEKRWQALREAGEATQNEWHHLCKDLRFTVFE